MSAHNFSHRYVLAGAMPGAGQQSPKRQILQRAKEWPDMHRLDLRFLLHLWLLGRTRWVDDTNWFEHNPLFPIYWVYTELPTSQINLETKNCYFYLYCPTPSSSIDSLQGTWKQISGELLRRSCFSWSGHCSGFILKRRAHSVFLLLPWWQNGLSLIRTKVFFFNTCFQ